MKRTLIILVALLFSKNLLAQTPQKMSYQAVIRNSSNSLITSAPVGMRISILQGTSSGAIVFSERQLENTNVNGLVSLEIGNGILLSGTFETINWTNGPYFIKTETDPTGGTNYTITGVSQFLSVPYSLHSKTAESLTGNGSFVHYIGELFGGGIIVSIWKENGIEHGLIASLTDLSSGKAWSNVLDSSTSSITPSQSDGQVNTLAIINQAGHVDSAAKLCNDYSTNGFDDWYLPSLFELYACSNSVTIINKILGDNNGIQLGSYWSSTDYGWSGAYRIDFRAFASTDESKSNLFKVRAFRRF